jgi:hypothetical protein
VPPVSFRAAVATFTHYKPVLLALSRRGLGAVAVKTSHGLAAGKPPRATPWHACAARALVDGSRARAQSRGPRQARLAWFYGWATTG